MEFLHGETVVVSNKGTVTDAYSGETEPSWDNPSKTTFTGVAVEPRTVQVGETPTGGRPLFRTDGVIVSLPFGTVVSAESRVEITTGPHAGKYEVDGEPGHWQNPFTGWQAGCDVELIRVKG